MVHYRKIIVTNQEQKSIVLFEESVSSGWNANNLYWGWGAGNFFVVLGETSIGGVLHHKYTE